MMRVFNVLNLGAGLQSSRVLLGACLGELPRFDVAVFADTQWEPKAVYANVKFLKGQAAAAGFPVEIRTVGDIRQDAIEYRRMRRSRDGKRHASMPVFVKNRDGSKGMVRRQCTSTYKIEVVERFIRRELLGLAPGKRVPRGVLVRQWFGISADEGTRAMFPGMLKEKKIRIGTDLFGEPVTIRRRTWYPRPWSRHVYCLLNQVWHPDRTITDERFLPWPESREDCGLWLARHFPGRHFPRSACIGCPFRSNAEWREMRDNRPDEWEDACEFDEAQRVADHDSHDRRGLIVGATYLHEQLVPLRMANLEMIGHQKGGGCGTLFDGQDGLCDV